MHAKTDAVLLLLDALVFLRDGDTAVACEQVQAALVKLGAHPDVIAHHLANNRPV